MDSRAPQQNHPPPRVRVRVRGSQEACGVFAGALILSRLARCDHARIMLPTGQTPLPLYRYLRRAEAASPWAEQTELFQIDEYCDLATGHPQAYRTYLERELQGVQFQHRHYIDACGDLATEALRYQALLAAAPMDVAVLGLGRDGHVAFNGPGSELISKTRRVGLSQETREDAAAAFAPDDPPTHALTIGMETLVSTRELILLVTGAHKQAALHRLLHQQASLNFPASLLLSHPQITIIADRSAAGAVARSSGLSYFSSR